jgi:catechol 2,3-dioxygenase-like lactoylglutathione lyase family enzyme
VIDHIIINVSDFTASKAFYKKALAPLGYEVSPEYTSETTGTKSVAFIGSEADFMIAQGPRKIPPCHVAFRVKSRALVKRFYKAAIAAGGRDFGKPKLYSEYDKNYFAAYVRDFDGHNIEAVCHKRE